MKHVSYFYPDLCPLTDIDREINRGLANRLGGYWHTIHNEADATAVRRDEMLSNTLQRMDWRRDFAGRVKPLSWSHADTVSEYS